MATTTAAPHDVRCGCCGSTVPATRAKELGNTPGVFICSGCAWWAVYRLTLRTGLLTRARRRIGQLSNRRETGARPSEPALRGVIPILTTSDVDRSCAYYLQLGFTLVERYDDGYLLMNAGGCEIHFAKDTVASAPGEMFVWAADAGSLWKHLKAQGVDNLGPVQDQPWGLREFIATDPDGNRIRFGSHPPH